MWVLSSGFNGFLVVLIDSVFWFWFLVSFGGFNGFDGGFDGGL